jgi:hypothetical protein
MPINEIDDPHVSLSGRPTLKLTQHFKKPPILRLLLYFFFYNCYLFFVKLILERKSPSARFVRLEDFVVVFLDLKRITQFLL